VALVLLFLFVPLANMMLRAFIAPKTGGFSLQNFIDIFNKAIYQSAIRNSLWLTFFSSIIALVLSFLIALALTIIPIKPRSNFMAFLNMVGNFGGLPLALAFMVMLGSSGVFILIIQGLGFEPQKYFKLYSGKGLLLIYIYFLVPLGALLLYPAFQAIRPEWKESAALMKANSLQFWWCIGLPVLIPSLADTYGMLFASAFSAYTVAYVLMSTNYPLITIKVASMITGEMQSQPEMAATLSMLLIVILLIVIGICNLVKKLFYKGGK
jgi:putative spermidine/putrescine transport system permease protein